MVLKLLYLLLTLLIMSNSSFSQEVDVKILKTNQISFPLLETSMRVYDLSNEPITGLNESNFNITIDDKNVDSLNVGPYRQMDKGIYILLCLDLSGSVSGKPLRVMKSTVIGIVEKLRSYDYMGIIVFADNTEKIVDFSNDKEFIIEKVEGLRSKGNRTALYLASYRAIEELKTISDDYEKLLIIMGDGRNEGFTYTEDDVIDNAKEFGIPVFSLGNTKIDQSYLSSIKRISEKSGGAFYNIASENEVEVVLDKLDKQIMNIYSLKYYARDLNSEITEHDQIITLNWMGQKRIVNNKIIAKVDPTPIPLYYYLALGALLLLIIALSVYLLHRRKVKIEKEQEEKAVVEKQKKEEFDQERKKRVELERKVEQLEVTDKSKKEIKKVLGEKTDKTVIIPSGTSSRTRIISREGKTSNLRIEILLGDSLGKKFDIGADGATIGRSDENNIVLRDQTISSNHAKIIYSNGNFYVEDLNSSNGTFINGKQVDRTVLNHNDTFKFGICEGTITMY